MHDGLRCESPGGFGFDRGHEFSQRGARTENQSAHLRRPPRRSGPRCSAPDAGNENRSDDKTNENDSRGWLPPGEDPENRLITPFLKHLVKDQKSFWTSPHDLQKSDWQWLAPSAVIAGSLVASDSWISKQVPDSTQQLKRSKEVSDYAAYSMIGLSAGSFLLGHLTKNDHLQETGLLSGEAAINSTAVAYFLKEITQRPRPYQGNEHGSFFQGGDSFPSEHAAIAWSVASVWAHEYPGKLSQILGLWFGFGRIGDPSHQQAALRFRRRHRQRARLVLRARGLPRPSRPGTRRDFLGQPFAGEHGREDPQPGEYGFTLRSAGQLGVSRH